MRQADIFLQHSMVDPDGAEEGLPVAILEAMANALPVVSTRHAGIPEAVLEEETGFLVDEGDSLRMSEQILLLAKDSNLRREMGTKGWQRAKDLFTWELQKKRLLQLMRLG
jgi:glycosyltransferase involved in cell wall biosynthesis